MTARDFLQEWLADQECCLQRSTWEALTVYVNVHLVAYFGEYELEEITPALCQQYARDKLRNGRADGKGGLSPVSVRKHVSVLKQALGEAVRAGRIPSNPAQHVRLPRSPGTVTPRTVFLTAEDAQAVNFAGNTIAIEHTVVKNLTTEAKDSTKTEASRRVFQLLPEVREMLLEHRSTAPPGEYVLARENGEPLRPDSLTRGFQRALKRAHLPVMRFHDLRHSTASILFDRGWQLEDVKNWLGHSDIETTSNIYLHYSRARKVLLARGLEGMLIKAKKP